MSTTLLIDLCQLKVVGTMNYEPSGFVGSVISHVPYVSRWSWEMRVRQWGWDTAAYLIDKELVPK
eukprot:1229243-Ditylum_brightwellii.AAC.1